MSASARTKSKKDKVERVVGGRKAVNPHFAIDQAVLEAAREHASACGLALGAVVRRGLDEYANGAVGQPGDRKGLLPAEAMQHVRALWEFGEKDRLNGYFVALSQAGWPLRTIAESVVDAGLAPSMSRQAVFQRISKVDQVPEGLPPVPPLPLRRSAPAATPHDFSVRVPQEVYDAAVGRAKAEGAHLSVVVQDIAERFVRGEFDDLGAGGDGHGADVGAAMPGVAPGEPAEVAAKPRRRTGVAVKRVRPSAR
jgi:hypothetical protein